MRKLGLRDVFAFSEIMDVMDLKLNVDEIIDRSQGAENVQEAAGLEIFMLIFRNFYKAERQIIKWVASLKDMTEEEVDELSLTEITNILKDLFTGEDAKDFFNSLSMTGQ